MKWKNNPNYNKEYYQKNKDKWVKKRLENLEEYRKKQRVRERGRLEKIKMNFPEKWEEIRKNKREYRQKPEVKEYMKIYIKNYMREWRKKLPIEKIENIKRKKREYQKNWKEKKKKTDPQFLIKIRLQQALRMSLKLYTKTGKIQSSSKYGINYKKIIENLKPFPEDISKYHIDHIHPLCSFDLTNPEEVKKAFAPKNHQWLLVRENVIKGQQDKKLKFKGENS